MVSINNIYGIDTPLWKTKEDYHAILQILDDDGNTVSLDDIKAGVIYSVRKMKDSGEWGNEMKKPVNVIRSDLMDFEILKPVHEPNIRRIRLNDEHYKIYRMSADAGTDETRLPSADTYRYAYSLMKEGAWNRRAPLIAWRRECLGW